MKLSGYWIIISTATLAAAIVAWFQGEAVHASPEVRVLIVTLVGVVLLALRAPLSSCWRWMARNARHKDTGRPRRDALARVGEARQSDIANQAWQKGLTEALKDGFGWRYRQSWLLLIGDNATIQRLLPDVVEHGWLQTDNAVLLWNGAGESGQPDPTWLNRLYKLRRRRPIDAVVLVTDSDKDLPTQLRGRDSHGIRLARIAESLRWAAPTFALEVGSNHASSTFDEPLIYCEVPRGNDAYASEAALLNLRDQLMRRSLAQLPQTPRERYLGELSRRLDSRGKVLAEWFAGLAKAARMQLSPRGVAFVPAFTVSGHQGSQSPVWQRLADSARRQPGRRTIWHPLTIGAWSLLVVIGLWTTGMVVSGLRNHVDLRTAQDAVRAIQTAPNGAVRLKALDTLQQQILRYEYRLQNRAPLFTRFGLNSDAEILAALWMPYITASRDIVVRPVVQELEAALVDLSQLQTTGMNDEASKWALKGHSTLKAYLMLAYPERVEADFLAQRMAEHWSTEARIPPGQKQDMAERFGTFYAEHLKANTNWRINVREELASGARQTLLAVIGARNAVDTIYQQVLDEAGSKYPDQTLASLTPGADPRGLIRSTGVVPGSFTRQAYEGYVEGAIEKAAKRQDVANDWVLSDGNLQQGEHSRESAEEFREVLTGRYFADYAEHWQRFMNGLQWQTVRTLPEVVDQLKLMADARQSPVLVLMKSFAYHGGAGARKDSLGEALVARTQGVFGARNAAPEAVRPDPAGPLAASFGPVMRLTGQSGQQGGGSGDLSLQRYLDRVTTLRLRLQQLTQSTDANMQARQMAQSLFQGRGSDLANTHAYAELAAASVGAEWAGMGETLFVRPIAQAEQSVLQPAQASLNEAWRRSIALPWNRAFASRYPFANTANDASLPELARYIRPQSGLINAFLIAELAGVLTLQGDQWVPLGSGKQGLPFDPAFLKFINKLQRVGAHMLVQGDPQYRFELKPVPTPGLTHTLLTVDNQKLHYFNQRETWQTMTWPASNLQEPRTSLQWRTHTAGTNKTHETEGVWAWVRMLEYARVKPIDSAIVQLTFQAMPDGANAGSGNDVSASAEEENDPGSLLPRTAKLPGPSSMVYPIRYQMRSAVGRGPLEALELRNLKMPERIFASKPAAS
ncbi:ImcF-related family protein [Cupriavidus agavae]|uniref:Type VI secretion system protein ImpL n=1 Tax=Cupriavidus agavae TaxID=1001822 RepID=A0A4Q7RSX5_9BURK|nr:ImcF-related family protein [Cupriavidus agavae]RZT36761.1 type VI secretion system protein ImpL [Cupriavidus agavae]